MPPPGSNRKAARPRSGHLLDGLKREGKRSGELAGNRTQDPRIKSALLYRLSYELQCDFLY